MRLGRIIILGAKQTWRNDLGTIAKPSNVNCPAAIGESGMKTLNCCWPASLVATTAFAMRVMAPQRTVPCTEYDSAESFFMGVILKMLGGFDERTRWPRWHPRRNASL